jgi:hypothetical protein
VSGVDPVEGWPDEKLMQLRYAEVCRVCGAGLPAASEAIYERASRTVRGVSQLRGGNSGWRGGADLIVAGNTIAG